MKTQQDAQSVLDFWFHTDIKPYWFAKSPQFDQQLKQKFAGLLMAASQGECMPWRESMAGRVAEIIVLDQFSRNLYRDTAQAFLQDNMALVLAQEAIKLAEFGNLDIEQRNFVLMPFMHSESAVIHNLSLPWFEEYASKHTVDYEYKHKQIIDRFGRYPHRNKVLGRKSTDKEIEFLKQPNSSF